MDTQHIQMKTWYGVVTMRNVWNFTFDILLFINTRLWNHSFFVNTITITATLCCCFPLGVVFRQNVIQNIKPKY